MFTKQSIPPFSQNSLGQFCSLYKARGYISISACKYMIMHAIKVMADTTLGINKINIPSKCRRTDFERRPRHKKMI